MARPNIACSNLKKFLSAYIYWYFAFIDWKKILWTQKTKEKVRKCIKSESQTPEKNLIDQFSLSRQIVNGIKVLNYPSKSLHLSALDIRIPPNSSLSLKAQNSLDFWIHPTTCQEMFIVFEYVCHLNTIPMIRSGL